MNTNMKELTLEEMEQVTGGSVKTLKNDAVHWFLTEAVPAFDTNFKTGKKVIESQVQRCKSAANAVGTLCTAFVNWVKG